MLDSYFLKARDAGEESSRRTACGTLANEIVALRCQLTGIVMKGEQASDSLLKGARLSNGATAGKRERVANLSRRRSMESGSL